MKKTVKKTVGASKKTATKNIMPETPIVETPKVETVECCGTDCRCGKGFGRWLLGLVLVLIGLVYLAKNTGLLPWDINLSWGQIWPLIIVILGLSMINRRSKLSIFFGVIIAVIALLLILFLISFNFSQKTYDQQLNTFNQEEDLFKGSVSKDKEIQTPSITDSIKITNIEPNQAVSSPIKITGQARGTWFFEGSFPVKLISESGEQLATGTAQAEGDWMTENFVNFNVNLTYGATTSTKAILIFEKDNPSGLLANEAAFALPVDLR